MTELCDTLLQDLREQLAEAQRIESEVCTPMSCMAASTARCSLTNSGALSLPNNRQLFDKALVDRRVCARMIKVWLRALKQRIFARTRPYECCELLNPFLCAFGATRKIAMPTLGKSMPCKPNSKRCAAPSVDSWLPPTVVLTFLQSHSRLCQCLLVATDENLHNNHRPEAACQWQQW